MSVSLRFALRVLYPSVGLPHGVTGPGMPIGDRPSPPPCGWLEGSIAPPRALGRRPIHRFRPALPILVASCSTFPTWPIVARQSSGTSRTSPDGSRRCACSPSLALICAPPPAAPPLFPPPPPTPPGGQDVPLRAGGVVQQRETRRPVGIVLDRRHAAGHAVFVPLEVDHPVLTLVARPAMADGDLALRVAARPLPDRLDQRPLGRRLPNLVEARDGGKAPSRGGGLGLLHPPRGPPRVGLRQALKVDLVAGRECDNRLSLRRRDELIPASPPGSATGVDHVHLADPHRENRLHGLPDVDLVRAGR